MKKKLLAAAVVSAFAAPVAFAQTAPANVTIYGSLQMEVFTLKADGANGNPNRNRTNNVSSPGVFFIGFRGTESLGGGLSTIWQIEQGAGGDGTGTSQNWGARNTFLGLSGGFGRAYVGIMDTPYKRVMGINNTATMRAGLTGPQGINAIMNNGDTSGGDPFISSGAGNNTAFSRRAANSVNYDSPSFGGFSVSAQYGANEGRALTTAAGAAAGVNPQLYSLAGMYRGGPFAVGLGWQQHQEFRGVGLDDSSMVLSASWTSGPFLLQGSYSNFKYATATAGDLKRDNWLIGGAYSMGNHRFRLQYQQANDTKGGVGGIGGGSTAIGGVAVFNGSGTDTGAKIFSANYGYLLSKRTELYAFYVKLDNDNNGRTNFAGSAGLGISGGSLRGMDADILGVGIAHTF
ncbi:MAG: porin [Rhodocyclaceae bacterium]|nr:porin [Rhodocyclaceae bacterium]